MDVLFSKDSYEAEIVRLDVQPSIISLELITLQENKWSECARACWVDILGFII